VQTDGAWHVLPGSKCNTSQLSQARQWVLKYVHCGPPFQRCRAATMHKRSADTARAAAAQLCWALRPRFQPSRVASKASSTQSRGSGRSRVDGGQRLLVTRHRTYKPESELGRVKRGSGRSRVDGGQRLLGRLKLHNAPALGAACKERGGLRNGNN